MLTRAPHGAAAANPAAPSGDVPARPVGEADLRSPTGADAETRTEWSTERGLARRSTDSTEALARERYASTLDALWLAALVGSLSLTAFLAAAVPTYGWVPLLVLGLPALFGSLKHREDELLSERVYSISHLCWLIALGATAAYTGGAQSFLLPLLSTLGLAFFARLRPLVAAGYASASFVLGCLPVLIVDWDGVVRSPWLLGSCAIGAVSMGAIASQMAVGEMHHRAEATIDQLTGLLNRRGLQDRLVELTEQALVLREDIALAVIACDLDHFKIINDTYGHARGDDVLRDVAYTIRKQLRRFELAYRMGGEEFLIILPGHDVVAAAAVAESVRSAVELGRPGGVPVTISMGVAVCRAAGADVSRLLLSADAAVYAAKRDGRNRVAVAPDAWPGQPDPPARGNAGPSPVSRPDRLEDPTA